MGKTTPRNFDDLTATNFGLWFEPMEAWLKANELYDYVTGEEEEPTFADEKNPTNAEKKDMKAWRRGRDRCAGEIFLSITESQRAHVRKVKDDPEEMWNILKDVHQQKRAGNRFNALEALLSIRLEDGESLSTLLGRVSNAREELKALRPLPREVKTESGTTETVVYGIDDLDDELEAMALIRSLPTEYDNFVSSLLLLNDMSITSLQAAFQNEESQRGASAQRAANASATAAMVAAAALAATPTPSMKCDFCGRTSHVEKDCWDKQNAQKAARERANTPKNQRRNNSKGGSASTAQTETASLASVSPLSTPASENWNTDTGASSHMTSHRHWFQTYSKHVVPIQLADHSIIYSAGIGTIKFQPAEGGETITLNAVLHVPSIRNNLFSLFGLSFEGYLITIEGRLVHFIKDGTTRFTASVTDRKIGYLNGRTVKMESALVASQSTCPHDLELWHRRLGHADVQTVARMHSKGLVKGLLITSNAKPDPICEPCLNGKQHRHSIPRNPVSLRTRPLALIHSDLKGPMPTASHRGSKYWITFICDAMQFWAVDFLRSKSDAFDAFVRFKAYAENFHGLKIQAFRDDKGGEYIGAKFIKLCADEGIERQHTEPDEPHQNGVAERANRTIAEGAASLLSEAKLPPMFWEFAVSSFVHVRNRTPTSRLPDTTPHERRTGSKPDIGYFRVFGCFAYVLINKKKRKALQPHTLKCIFIGYEPGTKAYRFWDPKNRRMLISSHVTFDERHMAGNQRDLVNPFEHILPFSPSEPVVVPSSTKQSSVDDIEDTESEIDDSVPDPAPPAAPPRTMSPDTSPLSSAPSTPPTSSTVLPEPVIPPMSDIRATHEPRFNDQGLIEPLPGYGRGARRTAGTHQPWNYEEPDDTADIAEVLTKDIPRDSNDYALNDYSIHLDTLPILESAAHATSTVEYLSEDEVMEYCFQVALETALSARTGHDNEPRTLKEALLRSPAEAAAWKEAAAQELQSLIAHGVFELVERPPGSKAIGSRWVFKVKRNADGTIERYKARLVAQGFSQRPGQEYSETFAPTPKWAALRAVLALGALEDLELWSVDISSAFLHGDLAETIFMEQPEGFIEKDKGWVWRLLKSLYGLKQAGREWHKKLHRVLTELMGFTQVKCEHSIWVYTKDTTRIIIPVFIDDMTIAAQNTKDVTRVISELRKHFKLRDLGPTSFLLGVEVKRDRETRALTLSQRQYTLDILSRANMSDCNPVATPLDPNVILSSSDCPSTPEEWEGMSKIPYLNTLGAVAYLAIATRPDISYAVGVLSRFSHNPGKPHWEALKRLLRYLKGTIDFGIQYQPLSPATQERFTTFSDADHMGNPDNRRSTGGYVVKMGTGAISWSSRLQPFATLSTTEAEYISSVSAGQEILWLRNLFTELGYKATGPSTLFIDNQAALSVAKNPQHHGRVKHLDLRYYWLRDEVEKGTIIVRHLRTDDMPADILTKSLQRPKLIHMRSLLGVTDLSN